MQDFPRYFLFEKDNELYQLNRTVSPRTVETLIDKIVVRFRTLFPVSLVATTLISAITLYQGAIYEPAWNLVVPSIIFTFGFYMPYLSMSNAYNAIWRNLKYLRKINKYYEKMRKLEKERIKNPNKEREINAKREKLTKKLLTHFQKETLKNDRLAKRYNKRI